MNRDQDEFAKKIKGYLDAGAADLRAGTVYRLQQARAQALARMAEPARAEAPRLAHALAGGGSTGGGGNRRTLWLGVGILLIVAGAFGWQQWQAYQQTRELEELDAQILSSDLPIDAYLDRGFQTWLTRYQP
ncbi:MAG: DUF3619 family protein [Burkholderiales bacterium]